MSLPAEAGICPHHAEPIRRVCQRCGDFGCPKCFAGDGPLCIRCAPAGVPKPIDFGDSLGWVFKSPGWGWKVAGGAACVLFSFLILPMFALLGYELRIAREVRRDPKSLLPEWDEPFSLIWDGLKLWLVFMIPLFLLYIAMAAVIVLVAAVMAAAGAGSSGGRPSDAFAVAFGLGFMGFFLLMIPLALIVAYVAPAARVEYLRSGSVLSGLHLGSLWRMISTKPGEYFMFFICGFIARILAGFVGQLLCLVGIFATAPWAAYTEGHLIGRFWSILDARDAAGESA